MSRRAYLDPEDLIPTRRSLLSRLKDWDDQDSWKTFFDTYWRLIYATALKAGLNEVEAQEVVQETVICIAKKIHNFKYDPALGSFKGWLLNLTQWRIIDQFRKRSSSTAKFEEPLDKDGDRISAVEDIPDPEGFSLDGIWEEEWQKNLFKAAMERVKLRVKEEHYQMFDLYVIKKWPVIKVARTLGVSAARVYLAKHRVSALVKKELKRLESKLF